VFTLRRTVRCVINPGDHPDRASSPRPPGVNGFAGTPAMRGLGRYYEFEIACEGTPDPATGYLIDIKDCDRAVRDVLVPRIIAACVPPNDAATDPAQLLADAFAALAQHIAQRPHARTPAHLARVRWWLTPWYSVEVERPMTDSNSPTSAPTSAPTTALLRQRFDFAAAHRLHVPTMSDEANRAAFGKCNNLNGHGHNYQFEPAVRVPLDQPGAARAVGFTLNDLEVAADAAILARFDHTHLNLDTPEFATATGVNPSVENIARVFFHALRTRLASTHPGATLVSMTVWETDRTCAEYRE
jgi:6-pyruvoyltetrahydropterin/6-carboxytetrahydropterin synthase